MSFADDPEHREHREISMEAMVKIATALLPEYGEHHNLRSHQLPNVQSNQLMSWYAQYVALLNSEQITEWCAKHEVTEKEHEDFVLLCHDPLGGNRMAGAWPQVILAGRGIPKHELAFIHQVVLLRWRDGAVAPLSCFVPSEMVGEEGLFRDGTTCTAMQMGASGLSDVIANVSLDVLHDQQSFQVSKNAFEILMGAMLLFMQGAEFKHPTTGNMVRCHPDHLPEVQNLMRLFQGYFSPPIPSEMREQIQQKRAEIARRKAKQAAQGQPAPGPAGGWDA